MYRSLFKGLQEHHTIPCKSKYNGLSTPLSRDSQGDSYVSHVCCLKPETAGPPFLCGCAVCPLRLAVLSRTALAAEEGDLDAIKPPGLTLTAKFFRRWSRCFIPDGRANKATRVATRHFLGCRSLSALSFIILLINRCYIAPSVYSLQSLKRPHHLILSKIGWFLAASATAGDSSCASRQRACTEGQDEGLAGEVLEGSWFDAKTEGFDSCPCGSSEKAYCLWPPSNIFVYPSIEHRSIRQVTQQAYQQGASSEGGVREITVLDEGGSGHGSRFISLADGFANQKHQCYRSGAQYHQVNFVVTFYWNMTQTYL